MTLEAPRGRRGSPTSSHQRRQQPAERGGSTTRQARITDFFAPPVRTLRAAPSRACSHPEPVALTAEAQCHSEAQAGGPARAQPSTGGAEQARFVEEAASTRTSTSTSTSPSSSSPSTPEAEAPLEGQPQAEGQKAPIASRPPTHAGGMAAGQGRLEDTHQHAEVAGQARLERRIFGREVAGTLVGRGLDRADAATVAAGACRAHVAAVAADAGSGKLAPRLPLTESPFRESCHRRRCWTTGSTGPSRPVLRSRGGNRGGPSTTTRTDGHCPASQEARSPPDWIGKPQRRTSSRCTRLNTALAPHQRQCTLQAPQHRR